MRPVPMLLAEGVTSPGGVVADMFVTLLLSTVIGSPMEKGNGSGMGGQQAAGCEHAGGIAAVELVSDFSRLRYRNHGGCWVSETSPGSPRSPAFPVRSS
jgi:hypothetical protein